MLSSQASHNNNRFLENDASRTQQAARIEKVALVLVTNGVSERQKFDMLIWRLHAMAIAFFTRHCDGRRPNARAPLFRQHRLAARARK